MGRRNDEIDRIATEWAARMAAGELTPDEQQHFDAWCAADIRHLGAFTRVRAILIRLERLRAVSADALRATIAQMPADPDSALTIAASEAPPAQIDLPAGHDRPQVARRLSALTGRKPEWTRRRLLMTGSAAASIAAAVFVTAKVWNSEPNLYTTRVGETRKIQLEDGSVVTLNTDSRLFVGYTDAVRRIRLEKGEALFKVAKNKARPFIVEASDAEVRAVGTSFTVRLLPERPIRIVVQEGVVEVARYGIRNAKPVRAVADTQTLVSPAAPITVNPLPPPQIARQLAWQYGRIAFENETLADAAVEFARYSDTKLIIDPAVSNRTITGLFASNDPVGFAKVAASVLDLHVKVAANEVRIVPVR